MIVPAQREFAEAMRARRAKWAAIAAVPAAIAPDVRAVMSEWAASAERLMRAEQQRAWRLRTPRMWIIVDQVANAAGFSRCEILSHVRTNRIVLVRHFVFWRIRTETRMSLMQMSGRLGFDHSSIIHAVRRIARMVSTSDVPPAYRALWRDLMATRGVEPISLPPFPFHKPEARA